VTVLDLLLVVYIGGLFATAVVCSLIERAALNNHPYRFLFRLVASVAWPWFWLDHLVHAIQRERT
jgi:hypothetical protein